VDPRENGPWDVSEFEDDGVERLDLGALRIAPAEGIDVQVQVDEQSGKVAQLSFTMKGAAVQVQPYAAPRSGGIWDDVRGQIKQSINSNGGLVEEAEGPFGVELRAQVPSGDGSKALQPARFCGVEGPRWFLRAVFLGSAARASADAETLEAMVRNLVVVRGTEAMPVGAPLSLAVPQAPGEGAADGPPTPPSPFERGPEITETR
jgi:hypothetical protein